MTASSASLPASTRPIGVFDSGVGGLSVLRALMAELPHERFVYLSDNGHAPYGERDEAHVIARSQAAATELVRSHQIKALVVACNTATAAAIRHLRHSNPHLALVGIEPAIKPAAASSSTKRVGVMATRATLQSEKFQTLLSTQADQAHFVLQPCDGLAWAIECHDATKIAALCKEYTRAMGPFGTQPGDIDTLVLGCTHYPFVETELRQHIGPHVHLLEGGIPVARHTRRLLTGAHLLAQEMLHVTAPPARAAFYSTGERSELSKATKRWLSLDAPVVHIDF